MQASVGQKYRIFVSVRLSWEILAYFVIFVNSFVIFGNLANNLSFFGKLRNFPGKLKLAKILVVYIIYVFIDLYHGNMPKH